MKVRARFSENQPAYRYFPLKDGSADVFIYSFVEEVIEEGETSFIYDMNEFKVKQDEITEKMIKKNPMDYIDYSNEEYNASLEERVSAMEDAVMELSEVIFNG